MFGLNMMEEGPGLTQFGKCQCGIPMLLLLLQLFGYNVMLKLELIHFFISYPQMYSPTMLPNNMKSWWGAYCGRYKLCCGRVPQL